MRSRRSVEHQEAVERRLALLVPPDPGPPLPVPTPDTDSWGGHTRVRGEPPPAPLAVRAPVLQEVPVPGRHASRRPTAAPVLPAGLGPLRLGVAHLAVLAVVVALGLALTSWWVVRSEPVPVSAPVRESPVDGGLGAALEPSPPGATSALEPAGTVVVDVAGRVRRPGVLELPDGSRVVDAIEAAGGARGGVDLSGLNLARVLVDGEQVLVGTTPSVGPAPAPGAATAPGAAAPLVDLNTADQATLESLPDIGPVTAQAILSWREEHGGFTAVQELLEVDGIGPATLETLVPLVTV